MSFMDEYVKPFIKDDLVPFVIDAAIAAAIIFIGFALVKKLHKIMRKALEKRGVEASLVPFLTNIVSISLKVLLVITAIGIMGIPTTSLAAILAAAGLAIGMALSGTLQNFAGGVMILIFKPFKVGDYIEAQGHGGTVKEIGLFITTMTALDNRTIMLPNGPLSSGSMVNFSTEENRRVDWTFGIGYGDEPAKARQVLLKLISEDERILRGEGFDPFIEVGELGDSSVNLKCRVWVKNPDYWPVYFQMQEKVYNAFNAEGLNIPFPQMDVHVHNA
ncbi:mechanosensitive ion channel family protein [Parvicella tangerina]|uniref:Small-conductance mechanosensitive channel n=1 Tax=Parvicella tangerina TaxID=2829795 RepID=A0A916JJR5_9FLAO|nr:mechanosensitive ion channel domain-containing protein [Parvicella tangerina]CAG5077721.1 Small-conductance mechanosensitive channel [Parvicella tangerina]